MDFRQEFKSSFIRLPALGAGMSEYSLLGEVYGSTPDHTVGDMISVLAHSSITCQPPFSYHIRSLGCYLLLLTTSGSGTLRYGNRTLELKEKTLLFFDCRQPFSLFINHSFWNFEAYFLTGTNLKNYYELLKELEQPFNLHTNSSVFQHFKALDRNNKTYADRNPVLDVKCLTDIFTEIALIRRAEDEPAEKIPPYLLYMKKCFDYSYAENYTLADFEQKLEISKYRLCREFSKHFSLSPLQYLNHRRIDIAKDLLCTTAEPVHEIGSSIGIDNTNHFIGLFKRETGFTPTAYRQHLLEQNG